MAEEGKESRRRVLRVLHRLQEDIEASAVEVELVFRDRSQQVVIVVQHDGGDSETLQRQGILHVHREHTRPRRRTAAVLEGILWHFSTSWRLRTTEIAAASQISPKE